MTKAEIHAEWKRMVKLAYSTGVHLHASWEHRFSNFLADMGHPPDGVKIQRWDKSGPFTPNNTYWGTR